MPAAADAPPVVKLSDEERDTGVLSDTNLYDAIASFAREGVVVLENAIPVEIIDKLNDRMTADTVKMLSEGVKAEFWNSFGGEKGNLSQTPPMTKEFFFPEIYANKAAGTVLNSVLGPRPELRYVRSNTLVGNVGERQQVHKDIKGRHLPHPCAVAANICLVNVAPENGSTELWLGTHNTPGYEHYVDPKMNRGAVKPEAWQAREKVRPPVYGTIPRGSLILRDLRLWHSGMPNKTPEIRVMLALVYTAAWYKNTFVPPYPKSMQGVPEELEKNNGTHMPAVYYDDSKHYLDDKYPGDFRSSLAIE